MTKQIKVKQVNMTNAVSTMYANARFILTECDSVSDAKDAIRLYDKAKDELLAEIYELDKALIGVRLRKA